MGGRWDSQQRLHPGLVRWQRAVPPVHPPSPGPRFARSLLLLGFLLPALVVWTSERRVRAQQFLASRAPPGSRRAPRLPSRADFAMLALPGFVAMYSFVVAQG